MTEGQVLPWTRYRKAAIGHLERAAQVPHFTVAVDLDVTGLFRFREEVAKVSMTALLVTVLGVTLPKHVRLRSSLRDGEIRVSEDAHVGVAIATDGGLVVPVVRNVDTASPGQVAEKIAALRDKASAGSLKVSEMTDAVTTLSNLGMYGVRSFTALLNTPQASILAIGAVRQEDGHPLVRATMTADHRVVDGADVARFLADLPAAIDGLCP